MQEAICANLVSLKSMIQGNFAALNECITWQEVAEL